MLVHQIPNVSAQSGMGDGINLIPQGLSVKADDARGVLIVRGAQEDIDTLRNYISLFDVKMREAKFAVNIEAPLEMYRTRTESTIRNTASWAFEDSISAIQCRIHHRMNDDNSFTVNLAIGPQQRRKTAVVRMTPKQVIEIYYDEILNTEVNLENIEVVATPKGFRVGKVSASSSKATIIVIPVEDPADRRRPAQPRG